MRRVLSLTKLTVRAVQRLDVKSSSLAQHAKLPASTAYEAAGKLSLLVFQRSKHCGDCFDVKFLQIYEFAPRNTTQEGIELLV